jgi:cytochrome c peroxidase
VEPTPIEWVRVHNMPDFVYFDHRVHTARNIACQTCHGPVQSMEYMRQDTSLSMGWCLDCHRTNAAALTAPPEQTDRRVENHVSTNCATCHL